MLGQIYFENRLGDIYKHSIIPYKCGRGIADSTKYFWELCVDVSGNIIFILSSHLQSLNDISKITSFSGISYDSVWDITCTDIHVSVTEIEVSKKHTLFCLPNSINLKKKQHLASNPNQAKAYFSNFNFSQVDCERGFFVNIANKQLCFQMLENSRQLIDFIKIQRISNAILSTVALPINSNDDTNFIKTEIESISWFVSFINLNLNFTPVIEYCLDGEVIEYLIENVTKNSLNLSYIIDNFRINEGIPRMFDACYQTYKYLQICQDINTFIGFLVELNQQKYIDLKIATMLMAYEYLLSKYLLCQGEVLPKDSNVQTKLGKVNKYLRFIHKDLMGDDLRESVRNPLFHQGEIPLLTSDDKIKLFKDYYDLLIKIVLKILGYTGEYMSVVTHAPLQM